MKPERTERMTEWDARPFDGGHDGLRSLVDRGFSGAVSDGFAWAVLVNGRIVGVFDGDLSTFEDAEGTAYEAPDPAVALLFAMQEVAGESRAQYYTEETAISTVDETLSAGGFTGFIELSDNVLSGDYYVVYSGGKSTGVAFVGNSETLYTGEEAFERADDEVGIYEVYDVDLDIVELPEPVESDASTAEESPVVSGQPDSASSPEAEESAATESAESPSEDDAESVEEDAESVEEDAESVDDDAQPIVSEAPDPESTGDVQPDADDPVVDPEPDVAQEPEVDPDPLADSKDVPPDAGPGLDASDPSKTDPEPSTEEGSNDVFSEEAAWRQAQTIPALDPDDTARPQEGGSSKRNMVDRPDRRSAVERRSDRKSRTRGGRSSARNRPGRRSAESARSTATSADDSRARSRSDSADPEQPNEALEGRIEELETALQEERKRKEALEEKREELAAERDRYRERASRLESRVAELEDEIERLREELSAAGEELAGAERTMEPDAAIAGTNLFVRYESKGEPTLDAVHSGQATREQLSSNLRLEHHTSFEDEGLVVEGQPFREFLRETVEYTFSRWVVEDLPFEIRETGNVDRLRDLYGSLPEIDRVEFDGTIGVSTTTDEGERENEAFTFDVVFRDRMGDPLLVANLNDSRDPTTETMVETLVSDAVTVAGKHDGFAAALSVTASFFDPGALDAVADATGGGLLSRSRRASFVKLSRKTGFHLCLVETRDGGFHLNVPEL